MAQVSYERFNDIRCSLRYICENIKELISDWDSVKPGLDQLIHREGNIINEPPRNAENAQERLDDIIERLRREHVKISFFGRNSCGKSTVINALLGSDVLPTGMGHVTQCFVHLQGTDEFEGFFVTENEPGTHEQIESLGDVASALQDGHAPINSVVRVYWPKSKCELLARDLILIDSPGSAISETLNTGIYNHCKDSDVFIIVLNAECILSQEELDFFRKVKTEICEANVFILINRWDLSDKDKIRDKVRRTHLQSCAEFLFQDTHVSSRREAEERIFFVSAEEILNPPSEKTEARQDRKDVFTAFAKIFDSLKSTKFQLRLNPYINSTSDIWKMFSAELDNYSERIENLRNQMAVKREELRQSTDANDELNATQQAIANGMQILRQSFARQISDDLGDARSGLIRIIEEFRFDHDKPSSNHVEVLIANMHLKFEARLGQCRDQITTQINNYLMEMTSQLTSDVPIQERTKARHVLGPDIEWTLDLRKDLRIDALGKAAVLVGGLVGGLLGNLVLHPILGSILGATGGTVVGEVITSGHQALFRKELIGHVKAVLDKSLPHYQTLVLDQIRILMQTEFNRTYIDCLGKLEEIIRNRTTEVDELEPKCMKALEIYQPFREKITVLERQVADLLEVVQNPPDSDSTLQ